MKLIIRLLLNTVAVIILSKVLSGVYVESYTTALIVAVVLGLLNLLVKPILVILTFPITLVTLGLFMLVINALIILLADELITGFSVSSIWIAILFSVLLSLLQSLLYSIFKKDKK